MRQAQKRETEALRVPIVLIMPLTFGITSALRALHNGSYDRRKRKEALLSRAAYRSADLCDEKDG